MFDRRIKITFGGRLRDLVWPRVGWARSMRYLRHRVFRLPGTPYAIAAGLACGAAISFTPFVGLHFVLAAALAWLIGASILASAIGTMVGNPWTFPFIWVWVYELGTWLGVGSEGKAAGHVDFVTLFGAMLEAVLRLDVGYLLETAWPLWGPMLVGGIPTAIVVWFAVHLTTKPLIAAYRHRRLMARQRRRWRRRRTRRPGTLETS